MSGEHLHANRGIRAADRLEAADRLVLVRELEAVVEGLVVPVSLVHHRKLEERAGFIPEHPDLRRGNNRPDGSEHGEKGAARVAHGRPIKVAYGSQHRNEPTQVAATPPG